MNRYLDQLLNVYWLRPETALWRSIDIRAMREFQFLSPSLDLGCGDGIFSFIRAGGRFDITFDAFQALSNLDSFFDKVDIFNSYSGDLCPVIEKLVNYQIDFAFDHKENLLKKAKSLGLHKEFIVGDANKRLPFGDGSFNSVFSNIIYWLEDPAHSFLELSRILRPKGRCCVMLPNSTFPECSFYYDLYIRQKNDKFRFLEKLDRGRITDNIKHSKSYRDWLSIIECAGLTVRQHSMHLSKTTIQIWDIGLRPIFPLLYKMASGLQKEPLLDIKKQWIDTFSQFLDPIAAMDGELNPDTEPGFHCFILEKE